MNKHRFRGSDSPDVNLRFFRSPIHDGRDLRLARSPDGPYRVSQIFSLRHATDARAVTARVYQRGNVRQTFHIG